MESGNVKNHHEHGHHDSGDVEALGGAFLLNLIFTLIEIAGGVMDKQRRYFSGCFARCW